MKVLKEGSLRKFPVNSLAPYKWNSRHAKVRYFVLKEDEDHRGFLEWYMREEDTGQGKYRRQIKLDDATL
eukprot:7381169-Prymnesium_polylepis.1